MRLENTVAIITGAGTGIGNGIAKLFAKEGASVAICGRRKEPLEKTVAEIEKLGGKAFYSITDISDAAQIEEFVEKTKETFGNIDILVNNAGIYLPNDVAGTSEHDWERVMNIDLKGVFLMSKTVLPQMLARKKGAIINIASIAGLVGFAGSAAYCSAKGAVINLTRQMAIDYASSGIRVNAIAPGLIASEMTDPMLADDTARTAFLKSIPLGKIGRPEDIGYAAVYLACEEAAYVTGQTVVVDGGWVAQ